MKEELIDVIYNDDNVTIKKYLIARICVFYKYDGDYVRIDNVIDDLEEWEKETFIKICKAICERLFKIAYSKGFDNGFENGVDHIQTILRKSLNIKE